jgi:hypothetical protein
LDTLLFGGKLRVASYHLFLNTTPGTDVMIFKIPIFAQKNLQKMAGFVQNTTRFGENRII